MVLGAVVVLSQAYMATLVPRDPRRCVQHGGMNLLALDTCHDERPRPLWPDLLNSAGPKLFPAGPSWPAKTNRHVGPGTAPDWTACRYVIRPTLRRGSAAAMPAGASCEAGRHSTTAAAGWTQAAV